MSLIFHKYKEFVKWRKYFPRRKDSWSWIFHFLNEGIEKTSDTKDKMMSVRKIMWNFKYKITIHINKDLKIHKSNL